MGPYLAAGAEIFDERGQGLVVEVPVSYAPVCIDGLTHFSCQILRHPFPVHRYGTALLKGHAVQLYIPGLSPVAQASVIDNHGIWLMSADYLVESILLPVLVRLAPVAVKPQAADLSVVGAENLH